MTTEGSTTRTSALAALASGFAAVALGIAYVDALALALYQTQPGVIVRVPFDDFDWEFDPDGVHARWYRHAFRATRLLFYRAPELLPLPLTG